MEAAVAVFGAALRAVRRWQGCSPRSRPCRRPSAVWTGRSPRPAAPSRTPPCGPGSSPSPASVGELAQLRLSLRTSMRATQDALHAGRSEDASLSEALGPLRAAERRTAMSWTTSSSGWSASPTGPRIADRLPGPAGAHGADHALRGVAALGRARPGPQVRGRRSGLAERPDRRGVGSAAPLDPGRGCRRTRCAEPVQAAPPGAAARARGAGVGPGFGRQRQLLGPGLARTRRRSPPRTRAPSRPTRGRRQRGRRRRRREAVSLRHRRGEGWRGRGGPRGRPR